MQMSVEHVVKTVHLVRHGDTETQPRVLKGCRDIPLSQKGRDQALAVSRALLDSPILSISSSDLSRTVDTANIIGNQVGAARHTSPDLRERKYGMWEGKSIDELEKIFGEKWYLQSPLGAEGAQAFSQRVIRGFNTALEKAAHLRGDVVIVTHGGPILEILKYLGREVSGIGHDIPNGSITKLTGPGYGTLKDFSLGATTTPPPTE